MIISTLCYIEKDSSYLMLHRTKKEKDVNEGKWIGVGGKLNPHESPEECVIREVKEETGLTLKHFILRGVLTFSSEGWEDELIFVYTADEFSGEITPCDEGELAWIKFDDIDGLNLWEGDRKFLPLLATEKDFFSMKLSYKGDKLVDIKSYIYPTA